MSEKQTTFNHRSTTDVDISSHGVYSFHFRLPLIITFCVTVSYFITGYNYSVLVAHPSFLGGTEYKSPRLDVSN